MRPRLQNGIRCANRAAELSKLRDSFLTFNHVACGDDYVDVGDRSTTRISALDAKLQARCAQVLGDGETDALVGARDDGNLLGGHAGQLARERLALNVRRHVPADSKRNQGSPREVERKRHRHSFPWDLRRSGGEISSAHSLCKCSVCKNDSFASP